MIIEQAAPTASVTAPAAAVVATVAPDKPAADSAALPVTLDTAPAADAPPVVPPVADTAPVEYDKTGDPGLDYALNFVGKLGFGPEHPAMIAANKGDFGLISAELATLGPKANGYEAVLDLAKASFSKAEAAAKENDVKLGAVAAAAAGSAERWGQVRAWASSNATDAEKATVNAALAKGGVEAKMAIEYLVKCYDKSSASVKDPAPVAAANAGGKPPGAGAPLTAKAYTAAVQALMQKAGGRDITGSAEYANLQQARILAMRQGA